MASPRDRRGLLAGRMRSRGARRQDLRAPTRRGRDQESAARAGPPVRL